MHFLLAIVFHVIKKAGLILALFFIFISNVYALVDINRATQSEFQSLPGITSAIAQDIITYRSTTVFVNLIDLTNVTSIDLNLYNAIYPYISVTEICDISLPDTLTITPIFDITYSQQNKITFSGCLYELTNFTLITDTVFNQGDCYTMNFTKTNDVIDLIDTDYNAFLCTVIPPEPVVDPPSSGTDLIVDYNSSTPDWGVNTDRVNIITTGFGDVSFTSPLCHSNSESSLKQLVDNWFSKSEGDMALWIAANSSSLNTRNIRNTRTFITMTSRNTFSSHIKADYDVWVYDIDLQTYVFSHVFYKEYVAYWTSYYDGDSACFQNVDSTTTPPLNAVDTRFNDFVLSNNESLRLIEKNLAEIEQNKENNLNLKSIDVNTESMGLSLSGMSGKLNKLDDIDLGIAELNSTLQNQPAQEPYEVLFPDWTPSGVESTYDDHTLLLQVAKDNLSLSVTNIRASIANIITPTFPANAVQACDSGVTAHGITIKICWTQHLDLLSKLGVAILLISSFVAIRIVMVG